MELVENRKCCSWKCVCVSQYLLSVALAYVCQCLHKWFGRNVLGLVCGFLFSCIEQLQWLFMEYVYVKGCSTACEVCMGKRFSVICRKVFMKLLVVVNLWTTFNEFWLWRCTCSMWRRVFFWMLGRFGFPLWGMDFNLLKLQWHCSYTRTAVFKVICSCENLVRMVL